MMRSIDADGKCDLSMIDDSRDVMCVWCVGSFSVAACGIPYFRSYLNILKYDVIFLKSLCFAKTGATTDN